MNEDVQDVGDGDPSLAWYGHPPHPELEAAPATAAEDATAGTTDVYGRLITSALVVGGALLLARSRTFRAVTWRLAKFAMTTWLPARMATEVRRAWRDAATLDSPGAGAVGPR